MAAGVSKKRYSRNAQSLTQPRNPPCNGNHEPRQKVRPQAPGKQGNPSGGHRGGARSDGKFDFCTHKNQNKHLPPRAPLWPAGVSWFWRVLAKSARRGRVHGQFRSCIAPSTAEGAAPQIRPPCGTSAAQVRHKCGTSAAQVRHKCGTSAAQVRHKCGTSAGQVRSTVRIACGTPEDLRRGVFWQNTQKNIKTPPKHKNTKKDEKKHPTFFSPSGLFAGTRADSLRNGGGTGAAPVRHRCGTGAAPVRNRCGTGAAAVRIACGTPADLRRGVLCSTVRPLARDLAGAFGS